MGKGLPLMTDNQQWLCHSSLFRSCPTALLLNGLLLVSMAFLHLRHLLAAYASDLPVFAQSWRGI
jgi:hypothetical protein